MEVRTIYFEKPGEMNTETTLKTARKRAKELNINSIIVASTRGNTAVQATKIFKGYQIIAVSHVAGFSSPNAQSFTDNNRHLVEHNGGIVLTTTHAFSGLSRAMRNKHNMYMLGDIVADTLRVFGQGMKVACEIVLMAADNGLIRTGEDVISLAGSSFGADTALVITPVNTHNFFDLKVKEIICKPIDW
jgi:uncharacterized protein